MLYPPPPQKMTTTKNCVLVKMKAFRSEAERRAIINNIRKKIRKLNIKIRKEKNLIVKLNLKTQKLALIGEIRQYEEYK